MRFATRTELAAGIPTMVGVVGAYSSGAMNGAGQAKTEPVQRQRSNRQLLNKVPEVTLWFWLIKIMTTTVGETAADFLSVNLQFGLTLTTLVTGAFLAGFLYLQLRARKHVPWLYWLVVTLVSVVGTLITDNLVDNFGVRLESATIFFGGALVITFAAWHTAERTLSVHTITTTRRELYYWTAILLTFALGTAAGDLASEGLRLGYANSAFMFGGLVAITALANRVFKGNSVAFFWIAYVLTRPLGASCGDLLSQPMVNGGLGMGTVITSALFLVNIAAMVLNLGSGGKKRPDVAA